MIKNLQFVLFICMVVLTVPALAQNPVDRSRLGANNPPAFTTGQTILEEFQSSVDRIQQERIELFTALEMKKQENEELLKQLNELSSQLLQLDYSLSKKSDQENAQRENQIVVLVKEKNDVLKKYSDLLAEKKNLENSMSGLSLELQNARDKADSDVIQWKAALQSSEEQIKTQNKQLADLNQEKITLNQQWQQAVGEKAALVAKIDELTDRLNKVQDNIQEQVQAQTRPLRENIRALSDQLDAAQNEIKTEESRLKQWQTKEKELSDALTIQTREKTSLEEKIRQLTSQKNQTEASLSDQTRKTRDDAMRQEVSRLKVELKEKQKAIEGINRQNRELTRNVSALESDRARLNEQMTKLKDDLRAGRSSFEVESRRIRESLSKELNQLRVDLNMKTEALDDQTKELSALKSEKEELTGRITAAEQERDLWREKVKDLESKADALSNNISSVETPLKEQLEKARQDLIAGQEDIKSKESKINELTRKQDELALALVQADHTRAGLEKNLEDLKLQLTRVQKPVTISAASLQRSMEEQITGLQNDLKSRDRQIQEMQAANARIEQSLNSAMQERQELQTQVSDLNSKLNARETSAEKKSARALQQKAQKLQKELDQKNLTIAEKEKIIKEMADEREQTRLAAEVNRNAEIKIPALTVMEDSTLERKRAVTRQVASAANVGDQVEDIQSELELKDQEIVALQLQKSEADSKIAQLTTEQAVFKKQLDALHEDKTRLQQEIDRISVPFEKEAARLTQKVDQLQKEMAVLRDENVSSQKSLTDSLEARKQLEAEINQLQQTQLSLENAPLVGNAVIPSADTQKQDSLISREREDFARREEKAGATITQLNQKIDDLNQKLREITSEKVSFEKSAQKSSEELTALKSNMQSQMERSQRKLENEIETLKKKLSFSEKEIRAADDKLQELNTQARQFKDELNASVIEKQKLVSRVDELKKELSLAKQMQDSGNQVSNQESPISTSRRNVREIEAFKKTIQEQEKRIKAMQDSESKLIRQIDLINREKNELENNTRQMTLQIAQAQADRSSEVSEVKSAAAQSAAKMARKLADTVGEVRAKEVLVNQMAVEQQTLKSQLKEAKTAETFLQESLKEKQQELDLARAQSTGSETEIQGVLKERISVLESENKTKTALIDRLTDENTMANELAGQAKKQHEQVLIEIKELQKALEQERRNPTEIAAVEDLQSRINILNDQLNAKQALIDESAKKINALTLRNDAFVEQSAKNQAELEFYKDRADSLQKSLDELTLAKISLQESLKDNEEKLASLNRDLLSKDDALKTAQAKASSDTGAVNPELENQIKKLRDELNAAQKSVDEANRSKISLEESLKIREQETARLQNEARTQKDVLQTAQAQAAAEVNKIKNDLETKIKELTQELTASQSSIEQLTKSKTDLQQSLENESDQLKQVQDELAAKEGELKVARAQASSQSSAANRALEDEIKNLKAALNDSQKKVGELAKIGQDMEQSFRANEQKFVQSRDQYEEKLRTLESVQAQASAELASVKQPLEKRVRELTDQFKASEKTVEELSAAKLKLEESLKIKEENIARLQSGLNARQAALQSTQERSASEIKSIQENLEARVKELTEELKISKNSVEELSSVKINLQQALKNYEDKLLQAQSEMEAREGELKSARAQASSDVSAVRESLEAKINQLSNELNIAVKSVDELTKAKTKAEESLKIKEDDTARLSAEVKAKEEDLKLAQAQASSQVGAVREPLEAKINQLTNELNAAQQSIEGLNKSKNVLETSIVNYNERLRQLQSENNEKQEALGLAKEKAAAEIETLQNTLQARINELTNDFNESQKSVEQARGKQAGLQQELKVSDENIARLQNDLRTKQAELETARAQASAQVNVAREQMQASIEETIKQLTSSQNEVKELSAVRLQLEKALKINEEKLVQTQNDNQELSENLKSIQAQHDQRMAEVQTSLENKISELTGSLKNLQQSQETLLSTKAGLEQSLKSAEEKAAQFETDYQEKSAALNALQTQSAADMAAVKSALEAEIKKLTDDLSVSKKSIAELAQSKQELETALKKEQTNRGQLQAELTQSKNELQSLKADIAVQLEAARKPLNDKIDVLVKSLSDAQSEVALQKTKIASLSQQVTNLEKSIADGVQAKNDLDKELAQTKAAMANERQSQAQKTDQLEKSWQEKVTQLQKSVEDQTAKITALTADKDRLSTDLSKASTELSEARQKISLLENDLKNEQTSINDKIAQAQKPLLLELQQAKEAALSTAALIKQKGEAFEKLNSEINTLRKNWTTMRDERDQLSERTKMLEAKASSVSQEVALAKKPLEDENNRLRMELNKKQGMLEARVQGLESELQAKSSELEDMSSGQRELESEIVRIMQERSNLARDNAQLQTRLKDKFEDNCGVQMQELQKPWEDKVAELKILVESRAKEIQGLKDENARLNDELRSLPR